MKSNLKILICDPIDEEGFLKLKKAGFTIEVKLAVTLDELKKAVPNYDILIVRSRTKVDKMVLSAGTRLKAVGRAGAGLDNIDVKEAQKNGIKVLNTPDAPAQAVAELTLGLMLSLARNIPQADRSMKEGKWIKNELVGWELRGKTLGTVGLGNIGERVAKMARAFGMKILINKRTPPDPALLKELDGEFVPLRELFTLSDIVTIHIPYSSGARHLIGKKELSLMKKGSYLINTSRGAVIDEKALLRVLQSGRLGGAALDVYEVEPPMDCTLMQLPNVVCTPHIGAQTVEAQKAASVLLAEKIINTFS